ncbi:MAG: Gfo/Idh/MocA family protein [Spirochaetota bacterium]
MLRTAIIGLGDVSAVHIPAMQASERGELIAVCDVDAGLEGSVPGARFYTDYEAMLETEALDCVHICLPHYLHVPVARACIEHGVHVLLEKPLALNTREALDLVALETERPAQKICVSLQNRRNESVEALLEIVRDRRYGSVQGVKGLVVWSRPSEYYRSRPWRATMKEAGGGTMINQSIHTLDLMQLVGGEIEAIRGSIDNLVHHDIEVEDTATSHIRFSSGARGLFFSTVSWVQNESVELQVVMEEATCTIRDSVLTCTTADGASARIAEDARLPGSKFYYGASHDKLINEFYRCIEDDTDDYIHAHDALTSIRMIDAIRESSAAGKEVRLP